MKAIITRYSIDKKADIKDDEFIFIHAFFCTDHQAEMSTPVLFSFDNLLNFISEKDEATGNYLKRIRYGTRDYGPKHTKWSNIMLEEDFDLEPYIFQFIESMEAENIPQHPEWSEKLNLKEGLQRAEKDCSKINPEDNTLLHRKIVLHSFRSELDEMIQEITLKYFPKLLAPDKQHLTTYKSNLIDLTLSFSENIDKITHDKI